MRTRTYTVRLSRWFPPADPVAVAIAKLCVLREDYFLELRGLVIPGPGPFEGDPTGKGITGLDDNSATYRRLYFFRNSMRTLNEIRNLVERILIREPDRNALSKEPALFDGFKTLREQLSDAYELVKELRDSVGGHVLHSDIENILKGLDTDTSGFFQDGEIRGTIRYRFASELVLSMMLDKVDPEHEKEKLETLVNTIARLIRIIGTIDEIIRAYIVDRKLLST